MYECGCGEVYDTPAEAEKCAAKDAKAAKIRERKEKITNERDSLRLQATSPTHFAQLLEQWAKKKGYKISVTFSRLELRTERAYYCYPIGIRRDNVHYPALIGRIEVQELDPKNSKTLHDLFGSFSKHGVPAGLNTGTGGSSGNGVGYSLTLWIQDFPLWAPKIESFTKLQNDLQTVVNSNIKLSDELAHRISKAIDTNPLYAMHQKRLADVNKAIRDLREEIGREVTDCSTDCVQADTTKLTKELNTIRNELGM